MNDPQLFWFGSVLSIASILIILTFVGSRKTAIHPNNQQAPDQQAFQQQLEALQQQCLHLKTTLQQQQDNLTQRVQTEVFGQLQTLLTNYPTARQMAEAKPDLPAKNLAALFTPLENLLQTWNIEAIGSPWQQTPYDPQLHEADSDEMTVGEPVYIRFVGYRQGTQILCPAKVSRTLPAGIGK